MLSGLRKRRYLGDARVRMMDAAAVNCSSGYFPGGFFIYAGAWGDPSAKCSFFAENSVHLWRLKRLAEPVAGQP